MSRFRLPGLAILALVPAYSTQPPPPNRFIEVSTTPAGATCEAVRSGKPVGRLEATLGVWMADAPITLSCTAPGHLLTTAVVDSEINAGKTVAILLLGGIGAVMANQANGDGRRYPPSVAIVMLPDHYPSAEARDAAFKAKRDEHARFYQARLDYTRGTCAPNDPAWCRMQPEPIEAERDAVMNRLDEQRQAARIEG